MIEFKGELSKTVKKEIIKIYQAQNRKMLLIVGVLLFLFITLACCLLLSLEYWLLSVILGIAGGIVFPLIIYLDNGHNKTILNVIFIDALAVSENGVLSIHLLSGDSESNFSVDDVLQVIDHGEWYQLCFTHKKIISYNCQKDLLVKGTLEEFGSLFEGKITKKHQ